MAKKKASKRSRVKRHTKRTAKSNNEDRKLFAFLAVFLSIIGFIIALLAKRNDRYVMYYAKQSLVLFIAIIIVAVINVLVGMIPIIGWAIMVALNVIILVLWIIGWVNALSGREREIPLIGHYSENIDL